MLSGFELYPRWVPLSRRLLKTKFIELLEAIGRGHRALSSLKSLKGNQLNNLKCVKKAKSEAIVRPYRGYEVIKRLSSLHILYCYGA